MQRFHTASLISELWVDIKIDMELNFGNKIIV